jgi:hypothetical protein
MYHVTSDLEENNAVWSVGTAIGTPALYSESPEFESKSTDRLSPLFNFQFAVTEHSAFDNTCSW